MLVLDVHTAHSGKNEVTATRCQKMTMRTSDIGMFPPFEGPLSSSTVRKQSSWGEARVSSGWAIPGAGLPCCACWLHVWMKGNGEPGCSIWLTGANARSPRAESTSGNGSARSVTGCVHDIERCHLLIDISCLKLAYFTSPAAYKLIPKMEKWNVRHISINCSDDVITPPSSISSL